MQQHAANINVLCVSTAECHYKILYFGNNYLYPLPKSINMSGRFAHGLCGCFDNMGEFHVHNVVGMVGTN